MNILEKKDLNNKIIYLWKPSKSFWLLIILSFIIWFLLGPIWWRHVDDFGPIQFFIKKEWSFFESYQLLDGFGSYPPFWSLWTAISYLFKIIGLTETRYVLLIQGFISTTISSYLTICVCLNIVNKFIRKNNLKIGINILFIEILSITFNLLNPEIMLHSITYMPYNLSTITTLSLLLLLLSSDNTFLFSKELFPIYQVSFSSKNFLTLAYISLFFGFQSIILSIALIITNLFCFNFYKSNLLSVNNIRINIKKFFNIFNFNIFSEKNILLNFFKLFLLFLPISYIYKFLILLKRQTKPGEWANGLNNIYDLTFSNHKFFEWIIKCFQNTSSIVGQSVYPFRIFQNEAGIFLSVFIIFSIFFIFRFKNNGKVFLVNMINVFCISILLSSFGNFVYSPTRHTIFLYPYVWILLILIFFGIHLEFKKYFGLKFLIYLSLTIYFFSAMGLVNSHKQIQYVKENRYKLVNMAARSDYFIDDIYLLEGVSLFSSHGSIEMAATKDKKCSLEKINGKEEFKFFAYNHRFALDLPNNKKHLQELIKRSNGCIDYNDKIKVIDTLEKKNYLDIEQNNKIYNGGSNIYAYILQVKKSD